MKYFEITNFFPALSFIKKMSHQNTDKCLNRSHFTWNLAKALTHYSLSIYFCIFAKHKLNLGKI